MCDIDAFWACSKFLVIIIGLLNLQMISNHFSSSDIHLRKNQIFDAPRNLVNTNHLCID